MERNPCPVTSTVPSTVESPKPQILANFGSIESPKVERESPEPNCAICLGKTENKSFTDSCLHQFCFNCLLEWSKVKPECPLCKQNFKSIIHNVRSNDDYDKYDLQIPVPEPIHWPDDGGQRFRYRSTLTPERQRERYERYLESLTLGRPLFLGTDAIPSRRPSTRRSRHRYSTSEYRASVYRHNLWVDPLPDVTGRYRECSPEFYRLNPAQLHRLVPWLNRELNVLQVPHQRMVILVQDIINMITQVSINSLDFQAFMTNQVGVHAQHFIHEFYAFARSPYDMIGFDETADYHSRPSFAIEVQAIESDSDSDIVVLSPEPRQQRTTASDQPHSSHQVQPLNLSASSSRIRSRLSPEPGPSGLSHPDDIIQMIAHELQNPTFPSYMDRNRPIRIDTPPDHSNDGHTQIVDSDSDDCVIVGYVKPRHERTPEIITLADGESETEREVIRNEEGLMSEEGNGSVMDFSLSSKSTTSTNDNSDSHSDFVPTTRSRKPYRKRTRISSSSSSSDSDSPPVRRRYSQSSDSASPDVSRRSKKYKCKGKHKKSKSRNQRALSYDSSEDDQPEKTRTSKSKKSRQEVWHIVRKQEPETDHDYSRDCYDPVDSDDDLPLFSSNYRPKLRSIVITKSAGSSRQREHSYSSVASSSQSSCPHKSKYNKHKLHKRDSKKRKERNKSDSSSPVRSKGKKAKSKKSRRTVDSSS